MRPKKFMTELSLLFKIKFIWIENIYNVSHWTEYKKCLNPI